MMKSLPLHLAGFNTLKFLPAAALLAIPTFQALAEEPGDAENDKPSQEQLEEGARLQIFLDRASFSPGKIDGRPGDFTHKSLALYREAQGAEPAPKVDSKEIDPDQMPDVRNLDLASVNPVFIDYTVKEEDLKNVGDLPGGVAEQAKLKAMPYHSVLEAIAEKFHADREFLEQLNEVEASNIRVGDTLRVPNVEPFELVSYQDAIVAKKAADAEDGGDETGVTGETGDAATEGVDEEVVEESSTTVRINISSNMLTVRDDDKLVAAYPVTIGSGQNESPAGDWKITQIVKMPEFRYDESMLKEGERSNDFHMLAPGPNNPVGVVWIQLNKTGIGLHGTNDPDSIGRSVSAGCVRLANWDVVRLLDKIQEGVSVEIK